ncbi:hypothetical protein, partial [Streptomyces malaysiense]|uniref:hypothetical protein n=1 Tax=Streptomyces malaysiense TaxID=1428626 RepID=UPI0019D2D9D6
MSPPIWSTVGLALGHGHDRDPGAQELSEDLVDLGQGDVHGRVELAQPEVPEGISQDPGARRRQDGLVDGAEQAA